MPKKLLFFASLVFMVCISYSQDITMLEIGRTFKIRIDSSIGTGFVILNKNANYFITAKHVVGNVKNGQTIRFSYLKDTQWLSYNAIVLIHNNPNVDIAVIHSFKKEPVPAISLDSSPVAFGQSGYFMGYPLGFQSYDKLKINQGFPIALVKRCAYSGKYNIADSIEIDFLDGHNNPGFSGGPVFFQDFKNMGDNKLHLFGVISAYVNQYKTYNTPQGKLNLDENSGIIISYGTKYIREILSQNGLN